MSDYLIKHDFPADLKQMEPDELELLAFEIRDHLIDSVGNTGGHLSSNLGVVELTIALHKVFDTPRDKLIWDVGHQSYVHKILTGRAGAFNTLRQKGGLSGFPRRCESEFDLFDSGHSSTSISLGLGLAAARDLQGEDYHVVSVIGDGALTGGMAFEALNNAGIQNTDLIVVLNDNGMSISPNIGGLSKHLVRISGSSRYAAVKNQVKKGVSKVPVIGDDIVSGLHNAKDRIKYAVIEDGVIFEELGCKYIGPVDGHDIRELCRVLEMAKAIRGPVLIHALTQKGKGYYLAEEQPDVFHGIGPFDTSTGRPLKAKTGETYSDIAGKKLIEFAEADPDVDVVCAAMIEGTGLSGFEKRFPDRIFDTGIAEGHAVTFAAGLAAAGQKPFVVIYSTFLQRAYDQILEDVCLQDVPVVFCLDRAGVVGADGETHQGIFDLTWLRTMPNMTLLAPADGEQLADMLQWAKEYGHPCAVRYPRGAAASLGGLPPFEQGKAQKLNEGSDVSIWAAGTMTAHAIDAAATLEERGVSAEVVNIASIAPIDLDMLRRSAAEHSLILTVEDNILAGGVGESIAAHLSDTDCRVVSLGWPDTFIEHGTQKELYEAYGLDSDSIAERILREIERTS